jgi:hypothetical protein
MWSTQRFKKELETASAVAYHATWEAYDPNRYL